MKKKILSVALAGALAFSTLAGSFVTASAVGEPDTTRLGVYRPSHGVDTSTVMFAMPGSWIGEESSYVRKTWEKYGSTAGLYWWDSLDNPDDLKDNKHGWPGWKMEKVNEGNVPNLYSSLIPTGTYGAVFSNFIDGGEIKTIPEYDAAKQTKDQTSQDYYTFLSSDYYPNEFWNYLEKYREDFEDDPSFNVKEFGKYTDNFLMDDNEDLGFTPYNMVYVVDYHTDKMAVSPKSGKGGYDGAFYFYYGNGEFGIWPTKELCIRMENLKVDAFGNVITNGDTVDEKNGFVLREHHDAYDMETKRNFVVFGNFTGKYWGDISVDPEPYNPYNPYDPYYQDSTIPSTYPSTGGNKINFQVNPGLWKNFKSVRLYMYAHDDSDFPLNTWGSKKGDMQKTGDNVYTFDFDAKGYTVESGKQYGMIFCTDTGIQTCDIIFDSSVMGDTAYLTGNMVENNVDSCKKSYYVKWKKADSKKYAPPKCVTSIGNVIGEAYWMDSSPYKLLLSFIKSDGVDGLKNAIRFNGKSEQQTLDDTAKALGLTANDIEKAIRESGKYSVNWSKSRSTAPGGGPGSGGSGSSSSSSSSSSGALDTTINSISYNSNATVTLSWSKALLANKYEIAKKKLNDKNFTKLYTTSTSFNDRSITCGTIYYYQIRPLYTSGTSTIYGTWSKVKTITTLYRPTITNMNVTSSRLNINWNKIKGVTKYKVAFKRATDKAWNYRETTANYFNVANPTPNVAYYVQVCPMNGSIMGQYSTVGTITLVNIAKPVVSAKLNTYNIDLSWKAVPGATGYQIAKKAYCDSGFSYLNVTTPNLSDYYFYDGTSYYYQVRAYKGSLYGPWSNVVTVSTLKAPIVSSTTATSRGFSVRWGSVYGANTYKVAYKTAAEKSWHYTTVNGISCEINTKLSKTKYYIQVCAIGQGGVQGPYSSVNTFTTAAAA